MTRERVFSGVTASSFAARHWLSDLLRQEGVGDDAMFCAEQVLAELISNGIRHTRSGRPGGLIHVRIRLGASLLRLEVGDEGSESSEPRASRAGPAAQSGHGLFLVDALTVRWWTRGCDSGRTMFAEIARDGPAPDVG